MARNPNGGRGLEDRLRTLTAELMMIPGLSGYEGRVRRRLAAEMKTLGITPHSDRLGNLIATLGGSDNAPSVMLFAHMDWRMPHAMATSTRSVFTPVAVSWPPVASYLALSQMMWIRFCGW